MKESKLLKKLEKKLGKLDVDVFPSGDADGVTYKERAKITVNHLMNEIVEEILSVWCPVDDRAKRDRIEDVMKKEGLVWGVKPDIWANKEGGSVYYALKLKEGVVFESEVVEHLIDLVYALDVMQVDLQFVD